MAKISKEWFEYWAEKYNVGGARDKKIKENEERRKKLLEDCEKMCKDWEDYCRQKYGDKYDPHGPLPTLDDNEDK